MDAPQFETVSRPRRLWTRMLRLIAASYGLDGLLLGLFVLAGALDGWVPVAYVATGLGCCALFHQLISSGFSERFADSNLTLAQLAAAAVVQLAFMVIAPPAALYFVTVLFIIFGFASLRLTPRAALASLGAVAVALAGILMAVPDALTVPHRTVAERALVGISILLTLARCTLLGLYGSHLRVRLGRRYAAACDSLDAHARHDAVVATALHDDLGQELAGISLLLSACATRLRREGHPGAPEVATAAAHLRAATGKTRQLADAVRSLDTMRHRRAG